MRFALAYPIVASSGKVLQNNHHWQLKSTTGSVYSDTTFHGHHVVLFFFCGCPSCADCARQWGKLQRSGILQTKQTTALKQSSGSLSTHMEVSTPKTVIVFSGDATAARTFADQNGLENQQTVLLPDPSMQVTDFYHADPCPRVFVIDQIGRVRYTNNHVDDAPRKSSGLAITSRVLDAVRTNFFHP